MNRYFTLFCLVLLAGLFSACKKNRWEADIDTIDLEVSIQRFDNDLFTINPDSVWDAVPAMQEKYPRFFELFCRNVINIGGTNELNFDTKLKYFLIDPDINGARNEARKLFDAEKLASEITPALKRYAYFFPQKATPKIYTHISGFNQSLIIDTSYVSISLDKYLGENSKYYKMLRSPKYKRQNMHARKIPSDILLAIGLTEFPMDNAQNRLIDYMIYHGKIRTFVETMLPNTADSLLWGYPNKKLEWCNHNERLMWLYMVENKLLFNSEHKTILRYIEDGPFTSTFSKESPARTGQWIGYRIVQSYLDKHPEVSLPELMENNNYQEILNQSKYKP
jgi:hypothetical protein